MQLLGSAVAHELAPGQHAASICAKRAANCVKLHSLFGGRAVGLEVGAALTHAEDCVLPVPVVVLPDVQLVQAVPPVLPKYLAFGQAEHVCAVVLVVYLPAAQGLQPFAETAVYTQLLLEV